MTEPGNDTALSDDEALMQRVEAASGRLDDAAKEELLKGIKGVVEAQEIDMTFQQAMQAAQRCQAKLDQEKEVYAYFSAVLKGEAALNDISMATNAQDLQGRPVVARIPVAEIVELEIPDAQKRAEVLQPFFAVINNYYAKRVTEWVKQTTIYMGIAASKMPS
jgi:hypothetical protein